MLDSELNSHDTDNNPADSGQQGKPGRSGQQEKLASSDQQEKPAGFGQQEDASARANGGREPASVPASPAVPAALFQAPQVLFQPPAPVATPAPAAGGGRGTGETADAEPDSEGSRVTSRRQARGGRTTRGSRGARAADSTSAGAPDDDLFSSGQSGGSGQPGEGADAPAAGQEADTSDVAAAVDEVGDEATSSRRRRRRSTRGRGRSDAAAEGADAGAVADEAQAAPDEAGDAGEADEDADDADTAVSDGLTASRRRRRKRRRGTSESDVSSPDDPPDTVVHVRESHTLGDDVRAIKGSTRLEAKKQRRREGRESGRRRPPVITESEFLARRESVERTMVVRQRGDRTQIAVLEDGVLVEHYVNRTTHQSYVGNVYLGKVQNVLPSMEAAFVDIGKGRNAVLYAGEVNFDASGLEGQPKRIESALKPGQSVIVQVTKDPVGHKGARLTSQVSLPGRYLVYVPGASMTGISRKLPDTERNRLKHILKKVTPENAGVIVRTAAEGAAEAELDRDVTRLAAQWENIEKKAKTATAPALLYGEPDLTIRVVRDVFNEDFSKLIVSGDDGWDTIDEYVRYVAPHLADRLNRWDERSEREDDVFTAYRIDEQLSKALERKVWLPSGGSLVIDRTEAMTVVDVNTGKFTGQGGNLEETVTRNNLEAAEEIVRQLRLRDVGGIVVIDFIDMVLESNRELVLRRLLECLARDRTKHQVAEVTSLGLVQMTRKRVGAGLLEAFSQPCECCNGRGVIIALDQQEPVHRSSAGHARRPGQAGGQSGGQSAGNGQGGRPAQDRSWPDRAGSDRQGSDRQGSDRQGSERPDSDRTGDHSGQDQSGRDDQGQRGRRGRRDGRTNGGTASASLVQVAEEATPAAAPVTVIDEAPPVVTPPATDAGGAPGVPVRRTRAGSAMARLAVTAEEPAAPATVITSVEAPAPDTIPVPATAPADQAPSVAKATSVDTAPWVEDTSPVADSTLATDVPVTGDTPATENTPAPAEAQSAEQPSPPTDMPPAADMPPARDVSLAVTPAPLADDALSADVEPGAATTPPVAETATPETATPETATPETATPETAGTPAPAPPGVSGAP